VYENCASLGYYAATHYSLRNTRKSAVPILIMFKGFILRIGGVQLGTAEPSGRAVEGVGRRPVACRDYAFESRWEHGCLSLVSVVCCQVEVSVSG